MIEVSFHRLAERELREVFEWYSQRDVGIAQMLLAAIDDAVERVRASPQSHPVELEEFHWVRVRRFPYRLIYEQLTPDQVLILAVAHTSRQPEYWQKRS